jgi:GTP-binding protein
VATLLHKKGLPVLLAANKTDSVELEGNAHDFESFGFPVFPVSALNNRGFKDLIEKLADILPEGTNEDIPRLRVAFVGRPNVGKSLLINRLLQSERVIVSSEPGTTRDSVDVPLVAGTGNQRIGYMLVDTAGVRQPKKIKQAVDSFSQLRAKDSIASADIVALVLDATQGPTVQDKNIAAQILSLKKGCLLIVNKWDLARVGSQQDCRAALDQDLPFMDYVPMICASAATGFNARQIIETINYVAEQNKKTIATGILNRGLQLACARFQAPLVRGGRLKVFYATQTATKPITFLLFVNDPVKVTKNYERYLEGALRKEFGFEGAPIILKFRKRASR